MPHPVANNAVAFIMEESDLTAETIAAAVRSRLFSENGFAHFSVEAESFTYGGRTLVIAKYRLPQISRRFKATARLMRR